MATCKNCGHAGLFLRLSKNDLCERCDPIVVREVTSRLRVINDSVRLIDESKNVKTRLRRCDVLIEQAQALVKYEQRGIKTVNPQPSEYINYYQAKRMDILGLTSDGVDLKSGDKPGFHKGKHYTTYVEQVKTLKRAGQLTEAETLLLALIDSMEAESRVEGQCIAPWYHEQLAIVYRMQKNRDGELKVLKRQAQQMR